MIVCRECGNSAPSRDGFCSSCGVLLEWSGQSVDEPVAPPGPMVERADGTALRPDDEVVRPAPLPVAALDPHDGLFCSACGARNVEGRTYCRLCGQSLDVVVAARVRRRWWPRPFRRRRAAPVAGQRPRRFHHHESRRVSTRRRVRLPVAKAAPLLAVLGLVGIGLGPARGWVSHHVSVLLGDAKRRISEHYTPVVPAGATASSSAPGHGAALAVDGVKDTWWQSAGHPDGVGETITVRFAGPVDVEQIGLLAGEPGGRYRSESRPRTVVLTVSGRSAGQVGFDDTADFQHRSVRLHDVSSVTLVITAAYPGQAGRALAIRELQFFTLQAA